MTIAINTPTNRVRLAAKIVGSYLLGFVCIGLLMFLCAGSISYWNAWLLLIASAITMSYELIYLIRKNPELLAKRLRRHEKRKRQKIVIWVSLALEVVAFFLPGLDYRFGWSNVPSWLVVTALVVFECGFVLYYISINQNRFASRVLELQENQHVIDTGMYAIVRHPMYFSSILIDLSLPILLGSYYMLIPMSILCLELVIRIHDEEEMLAASLDGYKEYMKKVRYRLIPFIW